MSHEHLVTYLNDHLAGSVAALELLDLLETTQKATPVEVFAHGIKNEVAADQTELKSIMERLNVTESGPRKMGAWLAQKMAELKLRFDDPSSGPLLVFEVLEAMSLGIEGKRSLWQTLSAVAVDSPALEVANFKNLIERADEQRSRVEEMRLKFAREALKQGP